MKTRVLHTRFWNDSFVSELSVKEKLLFAYLLTNEKANLIGIYEIPDKYIKTDLELSQTELDAAKIKLQKNNKIIFLNGWVKIVNHEKYNSYHGSKLQKAIEREMSQVPQEVLGYQYSIDTSIYTSIDTSNNHKSKTINNKYIKREDVRERDFNEIADHYQVPKAFVLSKFEDVCNWEDEKPGRMNNRNWRLTLMNWVKRDMLKIKMNHGKDLDGLSL